MRLKKQLNNTLKPNPMEILKIGTAVYLVHKSGKALNMHGSKVIPAKISGYQNVNGKVHYIIKAGKIEYDPTKNHVFTDIKHAVEAIESK